MSELRSEPVVVAESTRRRLSARQADLVGRLADAAIVELRAVGYDGLTVRNVARRAGVAPATAYTYFASKDHLVAEVFWRRLAALPPVRVDRRRGPGARVAAALDDVGRLVTEEPELAAACTTALLANDPDVRPLRERIGTSWQQRLADSLGDDADPAVLSGLFLALSGAFLQAGMGYLDYGEITARIGALADQLVRGRS